MQYLVKTPRTDAWSGRLTLDTYSIIAPGADGTVDTGDDIVLQDHEVVKNAEASPGDRLIEAWAGDVAARQCLESRR